MPIKQLTPMQERLAGVAVGAAFAVPVWIWAASGFFRAHVNGHPLTGSAVYSSSTVPLVITAIVGPAIRWRGPCTALARAFWNFALVGAGVRCACVTRLRRSLNGGPCQSA